jgi:hypothetical protein
MVKEKRPSRLYKTLSYAKDTSYNKLKSKYRIAEVDEKLLKGFETGKILIKKDSLKLSTEDFYNDNSEQLLLAISKNIKDGFLTPTEKVQNEVREQTQVVKDYDWVDNLSRVVKITRGDKIVYIPSERIKELPKFTIEEFLEEFKVVYDVDKGDKNNASIVFDTALLELKNMIKTGEADEPLKLLKTDPDMFIKEICSYRACNLGSLYAGYRAALFNIFFKKDKHHALDPFLNALDLNYRNGLEALENVLIWHLFDNKCFHVTINYRCFRQYYTESFIEWLNGLSDRTYIRKNPMSIDCMFNY